MPCDRPSFPEIILHALQLVSTPGREKYSRKDLDHVNRTITSCQFNILFAAASFPAQRSGESLCCSCSRASQKNLPRNNGLKANGFTLLRLCRPAADESKKEKIWEKVEKFLPFLRGRVNPPVLKKQAFRGVEKLSGLGIIFAPFHRGAFETICRKYTAGSVGK
jgi:hypothetical protein